MPIPALLIGIAAITAATGVGTGISGASKMKEANEILEDAQWKYDNKKNEYDKTQKNCQQIMEKFGEQKLLVWGSFDRFVKVYEKIKNPPNQSGNLAELDCNISAQELQDIRQASNTAIEIAGTGVIGSVIGGTLGGAVAGGVLSGVATFGVASTGTAIATLSGAAATNATLAAIGGGSLAAGGLGIAGGTAILGGLVAGPALAVGGLIMNSKGKNNLEKAEETEREVEKACKSFDEAIALLKSLSDCCSCLLQEIQALAETYNKRLTILEYLVESKTDYREFTYDDKKLLESVILLVKVLKSITTVEILKLKNDNQTQYVDTYAVNKVIDNCQQQRLALSC